MAASFVREVLSASGKLNAKEDFSAKAARLQGRINDLKDGLRDLIKEQYCNFADSYSGISTRVAELDDVLKEVQELENAVQTHLKPGLADTSRELGDLLKKMRELSKSSKAADQIRAIFDLMDSVNRLIDEKNLFQAASKLKLIEAAVEESKRAASTAQLDQDTKALLDSILEEFVVASEKIIYTLSKEWSSSISISIESERVQISVAKDHLLVDLVPAMHQCDILEFRAKKLGGQLVNDVLKLLLTRKCSVSDAEGPSDDRRRLVLNVEAPDACPIEDYSEVLRQVTCLFNFLEQCLSVQLEQDSPLTLFQWLGQQYAADVNAIIIKDCLSQAVPTDHSKLDDYNDVIQAAESLHSMLVAAGFTDGADSNASIVDYAQRIDATFANKRCQTLLSEARNLMKKNLHEGSQIIAPRSILTEHQIVQHLDLHTYPDDPVAAAQLPLPGGLSYNQSVFDFPECKVSTSVMTVLKLVESTLLEASAPGTSALLCGRLLVTARNILEIYSDVVPVFHADSLSQFPELSALAHNDFMFLAHQCLTLGLTVCVKSLPSPFNNAAITFADLVPRLRQTGAGIFLQQMRLQRDLLRGLLRDSTTGLGQFDGTRVLPATAEKCIRQVLHSLHHLRRLWQSVLPINMYRKVQGTLLDSVLEELVQRVVVLEDIAADACEQIFSLFSIVRDQGPEIFAVDGISESSRHDVVKYVSKWGRFKELIVILNASLRDIEDRWAGGKGPLAAEFTVDEVKRMIRAMFQNTERRADLLSKITFDAA